MRATVKRATVKRATVKVAPTKAGMSIVLVGATFTVALFAQMIYRN